ncbi:unnamed protein product [Meloidogyne enterolobii]|uniref:Uncharacterized protein n=1 Tax=Meloidogyne enterolobii TaxID=390850 RepID=A0ACB1ANV6_MELEN
MIFILIFISFNCHQSCVVEYILHKYNPQIEEIAYNHITKVEMISGQTWKEWEVHRGIDKKLIKDLEIGENEMAEIEGIDYAKECFDKKKKFLKENKDNSTRVLVVKKYLNTFNTTKGNYLILTKKEKFGKYLLDKLLSLKYLV